MNKSLLYLNNYETIKNILNFKLEYLNKKIKNFLNETIENKIKIMNEQLYNLKNEIMIDYNIDKNDEKIILFGENFVEKNKNKCYLLIKNNIKELSQYYILNENNIS